MFKATFCFCRMHLLLLLLLQYIACHLIDSTSSLIEIVNYRCLNLHREISPTYLEFPIANSFSLTFLYYNRNGYYSLILSYMLASFDIQWFYFI